MSSFGVRAHPLLRAALIVGALVALAVAVDSAARRFEVTPPVSCILWPFAALFAIVGGLVVALIGLLIWVFSRFRSRQALILIAVAIAVAAAPHLLTFMLWRILPDCPGVD
jgi:hypothetical protein